MSPTIRRGFILFGALVVITAVFCVGLPFFIMPRAGIGVAIPWIALPSDVLRGNVLPQFLGSDFTNTMTSLLVVDVIMILIAIAVNRAVSAWSPAARERW